jgi:hypothetical protein
VIRWSLASHRSARGGPSDHLIVSPPLESSARQIRASGIGTVILGCAMGALSFDADGEQDWRLQAKLDNDDAGGSLHRLVGSFRGPNVVVQGARGHVLMFCGLSL